MEQGSPEWHDFRRGGVGSSEVGVLMGESDFSTPLEIWKIKRGLAQDQVSNFVMQRGLDAEPRIRALYELIYGFDVPPATVEHSVHSYLRASLDGWDPERKLIVEIKYPGKDKHAQAVNGEVPLCYKGQVQYQLAVTGAEQAHYVSYDGARIAVVEVGRDEEYITRMLGVVREFWERVLNNEAPPMTERDFLVLDHPADVKLFSEWKDARLVQMQFEDLLAEAKKAEPTDVLRVVKEKAKAADAALEACRARIIERAIHPRVLCSGVQMIRVNRKTGYTYDIRPKEAS